MKRRSPLLPLIAALVAASVQAPSVLRAQATRGSEPPALPAFASDAELLAYLEPLAADRERRLAALVRQCSAGDTATRVVHQRAGDGDTTRMIVTGTVQVTGGRALPGANVHVVPQNASGGTGAGGEFRIELPASAGAAPGDSVHVRVRSVGHRGTAHVVAMTAGDSINLAFVLCPESAQLSELTVTGMASGASITNVQHEGVDEGGIVKVHGDHLVILRRGRLFTVATGGDRLRAVAAVEAYGPGLPPAAWYDELLVHGDRVIVVGYSYVHDATEIGVFRIDRRGALRYEATHHLRSDDYYSSRNYASRLIGSTLVFYAPLWLDPRAPIASLPAMRTEGRGDFRRIVRTGRIHRPAGDWDARIEDLALHTVTRCDLAAPTFACEATVALGPPGHVFYASPGALYLWAASRPWGDAAQTSLIYRLPLDGSAPSALRAHGSPVDQFSFLESEDEHLNVVVLSASAGAGMWHGERAEGDVALLRVPLASFGDGERAVAPEWYRALPRAGTGAFHNRFIGEHLLYGSGSGWGAAAEGASRLHVLPWRGGEIATLTLPHGTDRIEALGRDAVVIGSDGDDLHLTGIRLDAGPRIAQRYTMREASQGELRSHGFFYRRDGPRSGVLGLPVRGVGRPGYEHLFAESASVLYLRDAGGRFTSLGLLHARPPTAEDACHASCVDWYGNSRPVFLDGRVFALLGYELVEGGMRAGVMREVRRLSFAPKPE